MVKSTHVYNDAEHEFLHSFIPGHTHKEILEAFNNKFDNELKPNSLKHYISKYHIKTGFTGQFEKGNASPNKGKKGMHVQNSEKGWFKKGEHPHNRMPLGSETINTDGYRVVKMRDGRTRNFEFKHRLVWEEHYGPIPKGMMITFLDGNKLNCNIENLALVSRGQHAILNKEGLRFDDPELTKIGIQIAKIEESAKRRRSKKDE